MSATSTYEGVKRPRLFLRFSCFAGVRMRRRSRRKDAWSALDCVPETVAAPPDFSGEIGLRLSLLSILKGSECAGGASFELLTSDC